MRKSLLLSVALIGFATASYAQTAPAPVPATPPTDATPAATVPAKPMHRMRHVTRASANSEIRPGHEPGVGESYPASTKASNIDGADVKSTIAPRLPAPAGGENASINQFLGDAQHALATRQTGRAQEALERAETAMLQRSVPVDQAGAPDQAPDVMQVEAARKALATGNMGAAKTAISAAMTSAK